MEQPNLDYIEQFSAGDLDFKAKIIAIIQEELPMEIIAYQNSLNHKKYNLTAECVHKLKHKISILGLEKSYYLADQFEINLKQGSTLLKTEFDLTLETMEKFISKL